jgi:hypothetical protein
MNFTRILLTLLFFLPGSSWLSADELLEETQTLCTNIKSCVLEQMAGEDLSPEMRQQMEPMMANMCTNMSSRIGEVPTGHGLYDPAVACIRSMQSLSCAQMQDPAHAVTPECAHYEELRSKAAIN